MWKDQQLDALRDIAVDAGREILSVYNSDEAIAVTTKSDNSPLTEADQRAHELIEKCLKNLTPHVPVLSEESEEIDYQTRSQWETYWLVDPLDGTKEFVKRNGEFTVNIALIDKGVAVAGVVHVPVSGVSYIGKLGDGAWKQDESGIVSIKTSTMKSGDTRVRIVASRSHRGELLDTMIATIEAKLGAVEVVSMGSSLKICLLAEGKADLYPRLAPTCEWDTAAAHAVLSAAGGDIVNTQFQPLSYNQKSELLNPHFLALADKSYPWQPLLESV
ncbi:MAG: 3'(2'),5'-bisphosphate nucleotidase [SAR86 cluster bacterium]|uniref:3'(2'),5'-bisphosphate nucleotidase CysQ n=1 Tax=SAR86 cluster bacterium TaxID=2030880 RepID=A0A2A5BB72_9GAMM|nr:MAG: 3'(2'),5'-bisphosphate nucleotidase [SAR86 cluster bacterium]